MRLTFRTTIMNRKPLGLNNLCVKTNLINTIAVNRPCWYFLRNNVWNGLSHECSKR